MHSSTSSAARETATPLSDAPPLGLRERKAAATRIALARALEARLGTTSLSEITADQIATDVGVSRMTFFNYFPTKEHALDLLYLITHYEGVVRIAKKRLTGRAALELLFEDMGAAVQANPGHARKMLAHFAGRPTDRPMPQLGPAERALIAPDLHFDAGEPPSLGVVLMRLVDEARAAGEIEESSSTYDLAHLLGSLLFGSALVGHSTPKQDWRRLYRHHVDRVLGPRPARARTKKRATKPRGKR